MIEANANTARPKMDGIVADADTMAAKKTIMKGWKINAMLNSVSKVSAFVAGPLFAAGLLQTVAAAFADRANCRHEAFP